MLIKIKCQKTGCTKGWKRTRRKFTKYLNGKVISHLKNINKFDVQPSTGGGFD